MSDGFSSPTPRRGFVGAVVAGAAALIAGRWSTAAAATAPSLPAANPAADWTKRIRGKHRQVFDATEPNNGFAAVYALNFIETSKQANHLTDADHTAVVSYRHFAMPLTLNDATWAKYKIGEIIHVNDPKTNAPATRNIFRDNVTFYPGLTYESIMANRGVIMTACNLALTVLSGFGAEKAGVSKEQAKADWMAGLLPGVVLLPSGVYAVNRAQEAGCTFCTA